MAETSRSAVPWRLVVLPSILEKFPPGTLNNSLKTYVSVKHLMCQRLQHSV